MKGKHRNMWRSVIALVLTFTLVFGTVSTAFATTGTDVPKKDTINYVSLGDSMTNGYGLPGYNGDIGVLDYGYNSYGNQFAAYLAGMTDAEFEAMVDAAIKAAEAEKEANGKYKEDWFGLKFEGTNGTVNHKQLSMSGLRAEDLHWLLELNYSDKKAIAVTDGEWDEELWNDTFTTGDYWTYNEICDNYRLATAATYIKALQGEDEAIRKIAADPQTRGIKEEEAKITAEYYQNAVKDADIISLAIGNGNLGVFALGRILESIGMFGTPDEAMVYNVENAIRECEPEMQDRIRELIDELYAVIEAEGITIDDGDDSTTSTMEALANTVVYTGISLVLNYAGSVEAILQLNPDAEIILVALMNTMETDAEVEGISLGDVMGAMVTPLNAFIAALPTYMQATNNSVYKDATFYYAETTEKVECLVDTYEVDKLDDTVRDRFFQSIVKDNDGDTGMVWGLLGDMVTDDFTLADVEAYEAMEDPEKLEYAAQNSDKAMSISMYLAFERAIVEGKDTPVTLESFLGLKETMAGNPFGPIMEDFYKEAAIAGVDKLDVVAEFVAKSLGYVLTVDEVKALVNGGDTATAAAYKLVESQAGLPEGIVNEIINDTAIGKAALYAMVEEQGNLPEGIVNEIINDTAIGKAALYAMVEEQGNLPEGYVASNISNPTIAAYVDNAKQTVIDGVETAKQTVIDGVATAKQTVVDGVATAKQSVIENVELLCTLLVMPEVLSEAVVDSELSGLLALFARCIIGNGVGVHPSAVGHDTLFELVKSTYETGYTAQDKTIENLIYVINEYYDEAYAYAYEYAKDEGYIDATIDGIEDVEKALKVALDEAKATGMSDELKAELEAAYEGAMATTAQLKKLINEADVLDEDTYNEAVALMAALEQNLNDFCSVAEQVGVDTVKQLKKAYEYLKPIVIEKLKEAVKAGTEWLIEKIKEALPKVDKALYDWLYENPETVIGFFYYYGDDLAPLVEKYGDDVLQILLYVLSTYGPDAVEWALENPEEAIAKWVQWYNKHGHKVWPMIDRYLETLDELGAFDGLKAAVEELEAYVIAYAEKVVAELQAMYDELNEAAQAALEDLIAAIEAAKNGADNAVAEIMAALEELYDAGVAIYKGATSGYYTVTDDSYYVALGDTDVEYAQIVADEMKLDGDQFVNAGVDGLRAEDLRMILDPDFEADAYGQGFGDVTEMRAELIEEIEKSDLITLGFSNNTITEFAAAQIAAMIAGEEPVAMDWARLIGKDGATVMAKTMTEIKAALMAEGVEAEVVELVAAAIESYAYACTGFTCSYPEVVELIKDINPETQVVVVGMYNPFENAVLDLEGTQIPVGDFVGMLVDLVNVYYTSHAILTGDAIYVNAPAVETQAPFDAAMGIEEFVAVFADLNSLEPSAAGHEYIAEQIMSVMNVVDKDAFNTLKYIEQIKNFGEVTRDNLADAKALAEAARQAWDSLTDEEKALVGLDNYKVLVDFELEIAKVELGIAEDIEAAEKALAEAEAKAAEIERALKITESTVANLKAKVVNKSQIKVTWEAAEVTPDQYRVTLMKAGKKAGTYWVAGDKETVTLKNVLRGANFTVRVTPVAKVDGKKYFSIYKTSNKVKTQLQKANLTVKKAGAKKQIISKDQNSTGFQIYISKDKNFKKDVKKLVYKTNKKGLNVKVKAKNFKKGANYVKVRAYTKVNGKTVYGAWSGTVKVVK